MQQNLQNFFRFTLEALGRRWTAATQLLLKKELLISDDDDDVIRLIFGNYSHSITRCFISFFLVGGGVLGV